MDKESLRFEMKKKKKMMTADEIEQQSSILCQKLIGSDVYRKCNAIYVYLSYNQEVRTEAIIRDAWNNRKTVAVPKVFGDRMEFIRITPDTEIALGAYSIPEPVKDAPVDDNRKALVLMPGLAFDMEGHRCGYGGGFYDKYLAEHMGHPTVALCYDFQLVEHVETDAYDLPVDLVLTVVSK